MSIYLDHAATTPVDERVMEAMTRCMRECFYNPSAAYSAAGQARKVQRLSRQAVARMLGCDQNEVFFTSGGTEANNLAILGWAQAHARGGRHVVTTAVEHSSVSAACDQLEKQGYTVTRLTPAPDGTITAEQIVDACRPDTGLVAVMLVNNETGARFPLEAAVAGIRRRSPQAHIHCDAVQAVGKIPVNAERFGVDSLTASAHKIHGPKGCGVLYLSKNARLLPRNLGGKQEGGLRGGTEAVPLIAAFGAAAACVPPFLQQQARYDTLRQRLIEGLRDRDGVVFHLPTGGVPYIIHLSVIGLRSETMMHFLAQREIYVSSGSACAKGAKSPVLTAMGLPNKEIDSALRVSLCPENTIEDIDRFTQALCEAMDSLAGNAPHRN